MPDQIAAAAPVLVQALLDNLGTEGITYSPAAGGSYSDLVGIVSDPLPPEATFPGGTTILKLAKADIAFIPVQGDIVTIDSTDYRVVDVKERKIGLWVLALRKKP